MQGKAFTTVLCEAEQYKNMLRNQESGPRGGTSDAPPVAGLKSVMLPLNYNSLKGTTILLHNCYLRSDLTLKNFRLLRSR